MGAAVPYAIAAKFAYPVRPVIAMVGDGAMQMNNMAELITVAKYWRQWPDPRWICMVLNNEDLNQVTWEQRVMEGDPKFVASQQIPNVPYYRFATLLGLKGIYVDDPEQLGAAWDEALAADRPVVLEVKSDPEVPPLPPHVTLQQAKHFAETLVKGDPREGSVIVETARQVLSAVLPGNGSGRQARQRRIVRRKRDGPMRHGALADVDVVPVAVQHKRRGPEACASVNGILPPMRPASTAGSIDGPHTSAELQRAVTRTTMHTRAAARGFARRARELLRWRVPSTHVVAFRRSRVARPPPSTARRVTRLAGFACVAAPAAACAAGEPLPLAYVAHAAGPAAQPVFVLGWALLALCTAVSLVIAALLLAALFHRRTRTGGRRDGVLFVAAGSWCRSCCCSARSSTCCACSARSRRRRARPR